MQINTAQLGDCLELMKEINDNSINMIFVDFPYGTTNCTWDSLVNLEIFWEEANRILYDNGAVVATSQIPFTITLGASNLKNLRYEWIWEKSQSTGHLNSKRMPMKSHESVLIFYKKLPTYNPQKTFGHEKKVSTAHHKRNTSTGDIYGKCDNFSDYNSTERFPRSVLKFASDKQKCNLHPTQKPLALVEYFIKTYTNEGDLILDPCAGSGTTGLACKNLNRNFILIEKDEKYHQVCLNRIND